MNKGEILNLDKLSETQQREWLAQNGILTPIPATATYESLAECSYRLVTIAADSIKGKVAFLFWTHQIMPHGGLRRWIFRHQPIHQIQAALLAILDSHIDAASLCRSLHVQNCHECNDVTCGDNPQNNPEPKP